jgi:IS5 family transposase
MGQRGFWDEEQRIQKLQDKKPVLVLLSAQIPWNTFLPLLDRGYSQERKSNAGRKRIDPLILFKMLVLQQLFNLSDEELEFQVNDRRSFEDFVGLGVMNSIPDATTIAFFRERLRHAGVIEELFELFDQHLRAQGYEARGGQIIDATLVPVPKQRNTQKENETIKEGGIPEEWLEQPKRLQQKDTDARWTKKNGINHYGYKNSISVDVEHGFIRRYIVTTASVHDSQMLPALLDPTNDSNSLWGDSAFAGLIYRAFLETAGYQSHIHEKGTRNHPLSVDAKARNSMRSKTRARVEHVFGQMVMTMKGKYTRLIGINRITAWWGLRNLAFNFLRFIHKEQQQSVPA